MARYGKVIEVNSEPRRTTLAEPVLAGATRIKLDDVGILEWPSGQLSIYTEVRSYTVEDAIDGSVDDLDAEVTDVIEGWVALGSALDGSYEEDQIVNQYPKTWDPVAIVQTDDSDEYLSCRINDKLQDRLPTGVRDDLNTEQETVEIEESFGSWLVKDILGEESAGQSRVALADPGPVAVTSSDVNNPTVLMTANLDIPTEDHRVLFWASAEMSADDGTAFVVAMDDGDLDFPPGEFVLATFYGGGHDGAVYGGLNAWVGPSLVAPALYMPNTLLRDSGGILLPNGAYTGNIQQGAGAVNFLPTVLMPYTIDPPTPGLHRFRLTAWKTVGTSGNASVENGKIWMTVI